MNPLGAAAWPNPFPGATEVTFRAPPSSRPVPVRIFDVQGRLVREMVSRVRSDGLHHLVWDGRDAIGREVARGAYFIRIESEERPANLKVMRAR